MSFFHRFKQKIETVSDPTNFMISFFHDFVNIYSLKWVISGIAVTILFNGYDTLICNCAKGDFYSERADEFVMSPNN